MVSVYSFGLKIGLMEAVSYSSLLAHLYVRPLARPPFSANEQG